MSLAMVGVKNWVNEDGHKLTTCAVAHANDTYSPPLHLGILSGKKMAAPTKQNGAGTRGHIQPMNTSLRLIGHWVREKWLLCRVRVYRRYGNLGGMWYDAASVTIATRQAINQYGVHLYLKNNTHSFW